VILNILHVVVFVQAKLDLSLPGRAELQQTNIRAILGDVETRDEIFEEFSNFFEMRNRYASRAIDQEKHVCGLQAFCRRDF
jgi:hypothetical protein